MASLASRITRPDAQAASPTVAQAQVDGPADGPAAVPGTVPATGLLESTYDVEVKLSDLQNDTQNPLYSVSSFEELGL